MSCKHRLEHINLQIASLLGGNNNKRLPPSALGDEVDAISEGLNALADELARRDEVIRRLEAQRHAQSYRPVFEQSPVPMWLLELPSLRFLDVNAAALQHYGYSRQEFLSMTALDIRPADEQERYQQLSCPGASGTRLRGTWRHLRRDGSLIYAECNVHDLELEGRPARLVVANDVTERVCSQQALRHSEARLRRLYDSRMICFVFWDSTGEIAEANDYFLRLVGYSRPDLESGLLTWARITPPEYGALDNAALAQVAAEGVSATYEKEYIRKDGTRVPVLIGAAALEGDGEGLGVAYVMDISERKKMETEIRELNRNLEEKVRRRTAQLEAVNKELESFTYSVSHDLRAPLRAIHGFSRILSEDYTDKLGAEGARLLATVMRSALKMGTLIDELLEFSRIGRRELNKTLVNLDALAEEVAREADGAEPHGALIHLHPLGTAQADATLLKLVFQNLLSNAIKYSAKKESPEVHIGARTGEEGTIYYVQDNGAGFDMTYYSKLFGVFQRLHRQDEFEGIGVGLAIVQKIVARHGGRVWAEGRVGEGATFYFTLENNDYE